MNVYLVSEWYAWEGEDAEDAVVFMRREDAEAFVANHPGDKHSGWTIYEKEVIGA